MEALVQQAQATFHAKFNAVPTAGACAPGRVEVLGNHTDYNQGFILASAIDRYTVIVGRKCDSRLASIFSENFSTLEQFDIDEAVHTAVPTSKCLNTPYCTCGCKGTWSKYCRGVVGVMQRDAHVTLGGFQAAIVSNVPAGSGLSSSAALEVATALFLQRLFHPEMRVDKTDVALLCQRAENQWVGVQCGILDQFTAIHSRADHLLFLDCRDLARYEHIPMPRLAGDPCCLVLANTHANHTLVDGMYNRLRESCFGVAAQMQRLISTHPVTHLRDITPEELAAHEAQLPPIDAKRAKHIVTENARVLRCRQALTGAHAAPADAALTKSALGTLGEAMFASHASSRDDFGNSCPELDAMGARGAPLGGGFGGCTVNLVPASRAAPYGEALAAEYAQSAPAPTPPSTRVACTTQHNLAAPLGHGPDGIRSLWWAVTALAPRVSCRLWCPHVCIPPRLLWRDTWWAEPLPQ
ncbi:putative galactokinase [Paratrimastix pyriformis]|uniref:Galactokinase n=1 Tax=Paratrimastix pyriformis TaxID=342808 RepID=A0ABQ8UHN6_9EUKA|nr:putative galactokinase [Paratrimastix pyriformis]